MDRDLQRSAAVRKSPSLALALSLTLGPLLAACQAPSTELPPSTLDRLAACRTLPILRAARAAHPQPRLSPTKADGLRQERDAFHVAGTPTTSEHFALRAGPNTPLTATDAATILDALEQGFAKEVIAMELPAPVGSEQYLVNLYIGNSGGGAPAIEWEGAFTSVDAEGFPFMVVHPALLRRPDELRTTTAHELFHAVEEASGLLLDDAEGLSSGWYWEASAEWASAETFPTYVEKFVPGYVLQPEVALEYSDVADSGALIEYHQYGAALLLRYLTEKIADWRLVRDSWRPDATTGAPSAVDALDTLLAPRGTSVRALLADFALRNTIWDYAKGASYRRNTDAIARQSAPEDDLRVVAELPAEGSTGELRVGDEALPWGLAYNVVRVKSPLAGPWTVSFRGDATGDGGHAAAFDVLVARVKDGAVVESVKVPLTDGAGATELPTVVEGESLLLVVASIPSAYDAFERFGYATHLAPAASAPDLGAAPLTDGGANGCGCAVGGAPKTNATATLLALLLAALLLARTRRRS